MKRILVLSFFPAFSPPRSGGELRLYHLYRELSRTNDIVLISSSHVGGEEETVQHTARFRERRIPKDNAFVDAWGRFSQIGEGGDISGPCVGVASQHPTAMHLAYLDEYENADLIIHDSPFTIGYDLFAGFDDKPRVYNSYNCESILYKAMHQGDNARPIADVVEQLERKILSISDLILYCGEADLTAFRRMTGESAPEALFVPNGVSVQSAPKREKRRGPITDAVFIGSAHLPNVEAANSIVRTIAPKAPLVRFHIIGNCLPNGNYPPNVVRHGVVDNAEKERIMATADVALNPMTSGSGSNLKIFDFFQNALPVLTTSFGARGVEVRDAVHCMIAEVDQFARVLTTQQPSRTRLQSIAAAGRELAIRRYSWGHIADTLSRALGSLRSRRSGLLAEPYVLALNDYDSFASTGGGGTRTRALYDSVSSWRPVAFLCLTTEIEVGARAIGERIVVFQVPKSLEHRARDAEFNGQFHVSVDDIVAAMEATKNDLLKALYGILRRRARVVVSEHPYMTGLPRMFEDRFVYSAHNCEFDLKADLLRWHPSYNELIGIVKDVESFAIEAARLVVAVSNEDAEAFVKGRQQSPPVIVVRNGAPKPAPTSDAVRKIAAARVDNRSVVFLGSAHIPNVDAVNFLVAEVAPSCPDVTFHIVGTVCSALRPNLPPNVIAWGRVEDGLKTAILEAAAVAVNPMFSGSGSNVKLADYLANGLPVVSTEFGVRGYAPEVLDHVVISTRAEFAKAVKATVDDRRKHSSSLRLKRKAVYRSTCAMDELAGRFRDALSGLEKPRKRVLFVTYRYTWPIEGGAESMLSSLVRSLSLSDDFSVDIAATDVAAIENVERFGSRYRPASESGAVVDVPNLRYLRFAVEPDIRSSLDDLRDIWNEQPVFERALYDRLRSSFRDSGLAWGWAFPEAGVKQRWAFRSAGLHLADAATVTIAGEAPEPGNLLIELEDGCIAVHEAISGAFRYRFAAPAGAVALTFALSARIGEDVRPLGAVISDLKIANDQLDLGNARSLLSVAHLSAPDAFRVMAEAASVSRVPAGVDLTAVRGPHSPDMEEFLDAAVKHYDLIITHNNVFRPAVIAANAARRHGVASIMIPHAHLDDDYYHFPDMMESCRDATAVLAAPKAACDFFRIQGVAAVGYLPAGIDASERFDASDIKAFRALIPGKEPFVLVLGRKAGAKNYQMVIEAVRSLPKARKIHVVMIGPDDDQNPISDPLVTYLGPQPRNVVRGALQSSLALVNMSASESFGIVLLESWLAGRPVIANSDCAAFHDIAVHEQNALLVRPAQLAQAIERLAYDRKLSQRLADAGRQTAILYDWTMVNRHFNRVCRELSGTAETSDPSIPLDF